MKTFLFISLLVLFWNVSKATIIRSEIDSLSEQLMISENDIDRGTILKSLSDKLKYINPEKSIIYSTELKMIAQKTGNIELKIRALLNLANCYQMITDLDKSLQYSHEAMILAKQLNLDSEVAEAKLIAGNCLLQLGEYKKSSEIIYDAVKVYEDLSHKKGMCDAYSALGITYYEQSELIKANTFFKKSLKIAQEENYFVGISRGYNNIAVIYSANKDIEQSIIYTKKASDFNKKTGMNQWLGINYNNIALDYLDIDSLDSSLHYLKLAEDVNKTIGNGMNLTRSYLGYADYYNKIGIDSMSYKYLKKAYSLSKEKKLNYIIHLSSQKLQNYFAVDHQWDSAYFYRSEQYFYKDSLFNKNSLIRMNQLEILYQMERDEQATTIVAQRRNFINIILIIGFSSIVIILILLLIRYQTKVKYSKLKEKKLHNELEYKNKEATANILGVIRQNEFLGEITTKLSELESNIIKEENKLSIRQITKEIEKSTQKKIWQEFDLRFKEVHSDFYKKLNNNFPNLTPNELRLCAFLKLNMNTKEISSLTGQSTRAIEMARFRLRKKLDLSSQDINLISYISQF